MSINKRLINPSSSGGAAPWVAATSSSTTPLIYTLDPTGRTGWTACANNPFGAAATNVLYNNGYWVAHRAVNDNINAVVLASSVDGINWTTTKTAAQIGITYSSAYVSCMDASNTYLVVGGQGGTAVTTDFSLNGSWTVNNLMSAYASGLSSSEFVGNRWYFDTSVGVKTTSGTYPGGTLNLNYDTTWPYMRDYYWRDIRFGPNNVMVGCQTQNTGGNDNNQCFYSTSKDQWTTFAQWTLGQDYKRPFYSNGNPISAGIGTSTDGGNKNARYYHTTNGTSWTFVPNTHTVLRGESNGSYFCAGVGTSGYAGQIFSQAGGSCAFNPNSVTLYDTGFGSQINKIASTTDQGRFDITTTGF